MTHKSVFCRQEKLNRKWFQRGPKGPPQGPEGPLGPRALRAFSIKARRQLKAEIYLHGIALLMSWVDGTSAQREPNSLKMTMLAPRWAVLGDFGVILRHVGGKMVTKSARMSQHRRQGANPRGFEGSAGPPDVKHTLALARWFGFG